MQNCATCNYLSPEGAKFCRQCGAPLFAESESSGADTRNYGRQESVPAYSAPLPAPAPSVVDAFGPETARYYRPPVAPSIGTSNLPNMGPMYNQAAPVYPLPGSHTAPMKSKGRLRKLLKWGGAAFLLLMAAGIGAGINDESYSGYVYLSPEDRGRLERLQTEDRLNRTATTAIGEIKNRFREDAERRMEDLERAKEEALRAAERGIPLLDEKPLDLDEYEYPDSISGQYSRVPGKELLTLRTKDDFERILQHYQAKLGKPYITISERNNKRALFQTNGTPSVTVLVQETNDRNREKISILRSPFRFSKLLGEPANAPAEAGKPAVIVDGKPVVKAEPNPAAKPAAPAPPAPVKPAPVPENR
jgi:hypothetical protein